jgi:hypothetical protein
MAKLSTKCMEQRDGILVISFLLVLLNQKNLKRRRLEAYQIIQLRTAAKLYTIEATKPPCSMKTKCRNQNCGTTWSCCV